MPKNKIERLEKPGKWCWFYSQPAKDTIRRIAEQETVSIIEKSFDKETIHRLNEDAEKQGYIPVSWTKNAESKHDRIELYGLPAYAVDRIKQTGLYGNTRESVIETVVKGYLSSRFLTPLIQNP